jgi:hypothetical protein
VRSRNAETSRGVLAASDHESEARRCEKTDAPRAAALYRQAIVEYLESGKDPLDSPSVRRDLQRIVDRLSLVLKRNGLIEEALEEIDSAAYLGLVDGEDCGTKARRGEPSISCCRSRRSFHHCACNCFAVSAHFSSASRGICHSSHV